MKSGVSDSGLCVVHTTERSSCHSLESPESRCAVIPDSWSLLFSFRKNRVKKLSTNNLIGILNIVIIDHKIIVRPAPNRDKGVIDALDLSYSVDDFTSILFDR
jgi:hypothetical protein